MKNKSVKENEEIFDLEIEKLIRARVDEELDGIKRSITASVDTIILDIVSSFRNRLLIEFIKDPKANTYKVNMNWISADSARRRKELAKDRL